MNMKQRTIAICALLAAVWCAGCGSVFNGAIDDMTLRQTGWYTFLGGTGVDQAISVQRTSDGGYIVAGYAGATIDPLRMKNAPCRNPYSGSSNDMLIVKLDAGGNVAWYTFLGESGSDIAQSVQQTSDGGYIVAGRASATIGTDRMQNAPCRNPYSGSIDMLIVKLDSSGDVAWYTFLGSITGSDFANSVQQTSDSGYIIAGNASNDMTLTQGTKILAHHSSGVESDMLVVKLDSSGNVAWYTFLGGNDSDSASSVHQTSDGGYIVTGSGTDIAPIDMQNAPFRNEYSGSGTDMLVVKLDSSGNISWYTFLGGDDAKSVQQTSDGGYIVAGRASQDITFSQGTKRNPYTRFSDMLVVNLDAGGYVAWYTFLGGTENDGAYSVRQTADGGYIVAGYAQTDISTLQGKTPLNAHSSGTNEDMLVVNLDAGGNVAWYTFLGGAGIDWAYSVDQASDGGYIVAGDADAEISRLMEEEPLLPYSGYSNDMLVIKLKNDGTL